MNAFDPDDKASFDPDDEEWAEAVRVLREARQRSRGYAEYWEWLIDRWRAELDAGCVLRNFLVAAGEKVSGRLTVVRPDPPDVLLETVNGRRIGIEVTELVDRHAIKRHLDRKKRGEPIAFDFAAWTPVRMAEALSGLVSTKDHKLRNASDQFDELLVAIVTDEPAIDESIARAAVWLCRPTVQHINRAFLVMSYHPENDKSVYPDGCLVLPVEVRSGADLSGAKLSGAKLSGANMSGTDLHEANLSGADLSGADLSGADLSGANVSGTNLSFANLSFANLNGANLRGANLSAALLREANLSGANLSFADVRAADLREAELYGADLSGAQLRGANLHEANLRGADLSGADLRVAQLRGAKLSGAHLRGADLSGANLIGADLSCADLRGANLSGAHLRGANLSGADLTGANLIGAEELNEACGDEYTQLPEGLTVKPCPTER